MLYDRILHVSSAFLTLSRRIGFDKSWTSRAVESLVQEGLVEKVGSTEDRRTVRLFLSPAGEARLAGLNHTLGALADQAFEYIPADQHAAVKIGGQFP